VVERVEREEERVETVEVLQMPLSTEPKILEIESR